MRSLSVADVFVLNTILLFAEPAPLDEILKSPSPSYSNSAKLLFPDPSFASN